MTSVSLWIRDLGGQPPHGKGPGEVPGPGGNTTDRAATAAEALREVDVHLSGDGNGGGGVPHNGVIHSATQEQGHTEHCYAVTVRPM